MTRTERAAERGPGQLILLCGLPGAGKTTLSRTLTTPIGAIRLCPDETMLRRRIDLRDEAARARIEARQWKLAQRLLRRGCVVIMEAGFWSRNERDEKRTGARRIGARVELYYLTASLKELCRRLALRQTALGWAPVPMAQMRAWNAVFEPPDAHEAALFDSFTWVDGDQPAQLPFEH